ncbi:MAG: hypothetical protein ACK4N5_09795 [Myxococcales bacterium]
MPLTWLWGLAGVFLGGAMALVPMIVTYAQASTTTAQQLKLLDERGQSNIKRLDAHDQTLQTHELRLDAHDQTLQTHELRLLKSELATEQIIQRIDKLERTLEANTGAILQAVQTSGRR